MISRSVPAMILVASLLSLIACSGFASDNPISTISSPDKTYIVRLTGQKSKPRIPLVLHSVYFDLFRKNEPVVLKKLLHSGFWMDAGFEDLYSSHSWVTNSVIMFNQKTAHEVQRDTLFISNNTAKPINYLRVQSVDLFLIFDIAPKSRMKVSAYPQTWLSWITVEGEFSDGEIIAKKGTNFSIARNQKGPFQYEISINDDGHRIESPHLKEYQADLPPENSHLKLTHNSHQY